LKKENRVRMFEDGVLREMFELTGEEETGNR
jgi:hypothetical protein